MNDQEKNKKKGAPGDGTPDMNGPCPEGKRADGALSQDEPKDSSKKKKNDKGAATRVTPAVKAPKREEEPEEEEEALPPKIVKRRRNSTIFAIAFTVLYLLIVLIVSVALSMYAVDVAKDVFALGKEGVDVEVTLTGEYPTVKDLAEQLYDQHIIKHPGVFAFYAKLRHKNNVTLIPGTQTATTAMGYDLLLQLFAPKAEERSTVPVTVPEGYTVDDIIDLFVSKGIGTRKGFEYVINEAPFDQYPFLNSKRETYWFLDGAIGENAGQLYRLEGYLYPDTYFVYDSYTDAEGEIKGTAAAKHVVSKMLAEFNKNVKKSYLKKHEEYLAEYYPNVRMTFTDIVTLASILEKEARPEERSKISAVFYNRLNNPAYENIGGRLESNVTVQYVLKHLGYTVSLQFGDFEKNFETPYNSYRYAGLPPGPIVTPTRESINAALYPDSECTAYYFVGTKSGYSFFADTLEEHIDNIARAEAGEVADPFADVEELPDDQYGE
ncbi:MAG: endolytic transglycosylase MltG [Clostridia bacterium]|nr:endolytic transglycosylase MltG [Clostridia bacterium]